MVGAGVAAGIWIVHWLACDLVMVGVVSACRSGERLQVRDYWNEISLHFMEHGRRGVVVSWWAKVGGLWVHEDRSWMLTFVTLVLICSARTTMAATVGLW